MDVFTCVVICVAIIAIFLVIAIRLTKAKRLRVAVKRGTDSAEVEVG